MRFKQRKILCCIDSILSTVISNSVPRKKLQSPEAVNTKSFVAQNISRGKTEEGIRLFKEQKEMYQTQTMMPWNSN